MQHAITLTAINTLRIYHHLLQVLYRNHLSDDMEGLFEFE